MRWTEADGPVKWSCFDTYDSTVYRFETPAKADGPLANRVREVNSKLKRPEITVLQVEVDATEATANPGSPYSMAWSTAEAESVQAQEASSWAGSMLMELPTVSDPNWDTVSDLGDALRKTGEPRMGARVQKLMVAPGKVTSMVAPEVDGNLCQKETG